MPRLPLPGSDVNQWGTILNDFLLVEHNADGTLRLRSDGTLGALYAKPSGGIPLDDLSAAVQTQLAAAYQKPAGGIPESDLSAGVQAMLGGAGAGVQLGGDIGGSTNAPNVVATHLAAPLPIAQGGTGSTAQSFVDLSSAQVIGGAKTFSAAIAVPGGTVAPLDWHNVKAYGAVGDGATDDRLAIQAAIDAASAAGGGVVFFPQATYSMSNSLTPRSNVTLFGSSASVLTISANKNIIALSSGDLHDFALDGLTFQGTVNQFPVVPTRARTTSGPGCVTAISLDGNLDPYNTGAGTVTNFTMRNCTVENCSALPIRIAGVGGVVRVVNNSFINNQDVGFIYNAEVIFANNHVMQSADNGVSISRGNNKVTCTGNTFENCCYNGIWLSGFDVAGGGALNETGPAGFTCTGNTIVNVGFNGIIADAAPMHGVIAGNFINQGYFRGPSDQPSDANGAGIYIGGYPINNRNAPTAYATNITVAGNTLYQCARAGVYVIGAKAINVESNLILNCGTQFKADGTTAIAANDGSQNVGVYIDTTSTTANTNSDISVRNNSIIDERGTPYCNFAVSPSGGSIPTSFFYADNQMTNCRNPYNLVEFTNNTVEVAGVRRFDSAIKVVGGATAGSNAGTGTIAGFDINGAAGSTRPFRLLTAGSARWIMRASSVAESGGNAGSDFAIDAYDDTGTYLSSPLTITRSSQTTTIAKLSAGSFTLSGSMASALNLNGNDILKAHSVTDTGGNTILSFVPTAGAVNYLAVQNNSTTNSPAFYAQGSDADVGLTFKTQGKGTTIFHPGTDTAGAVQFRAAANTAATTVLSVDTANARVGVNTPTPGAALDVNGAVVATALRLSTSPSNGYVLTSDASGNASWQAAPTQTASGTAGGDLTGTYPNPTLAATANVAAIVRANRLDQFAAPAAAVSFNAQRITNVANGSAASDAAAFGQIPTATSAIPLANSSTNASAGSATAYARADHVHPTAYAWTTSDYGLLAQNMDIAMLSGNSVVPTAGTVFLAKMNIPTSITATNIVLWVAVAGASLTAGQNFAALYSGAGALLAKTADQSTAWQSTGLQTMALGSAQLLAAGSYYVAFWANGTTLPAFRAGIGSASVNAGLTGSAARFASANTGVTTTAPATLTTITADGHSWWVGLS